MRKLAILILLVGISSCYVYDTSLSDADRISRRYQYYYGYPTYPYYRPLPYTYNQRPSIIVIERNNQRIVRPVPRVNAFGPTAPPSSPRLGPRSSAPIRTFPKKDNDKDK